MKVRPYPKRDLGALIVDALTQPRSIEWLKEQFSEDASRVAYTVYNAVKRGTLKRIDDASAIGTPGLFARAVYQPEAPVDDLPPDDDFCRPVVKRVVRATEAEPLQLLGPRSVFDIAPAPDTDAEQAAMYRWLRSRPLDSIDAGGLFVGMTPHNVVINGEDLDRHIRTAMLMEQQGAPHA